MKDETNELCFILHPSSFILTKGVSDEPATPNCHRVLPPLVPAADFGLVVARRLAVPGVHLARAEQPVRGLGRRVPAPVVAGGGARGTRLHRIPDLVRPPARMALESRQPVLL